MLIFFLLGSQFVVVYDSNHFIQLEKQTWEAPLK